MHGLLRFNRSVGWLLVAWLCVVSTTAIAADPPREFTPQAGFDGASKGVGTLRLFGRAPQRFRVESTGTRRPDGTFHLAQTIAMQGEAPRRRSWTIRTLGGNRYAATLTDAAGPVSGSHAGRRLVLDYRIKGPLVMHQQLDLSEDGMTIDNIGTIRAFGIRVGRLEETITRTRAAHTPPP